MNLIAAAALAIAIVAGTIGVDAGPVGGNNFAFADVNDDGSTLAVGSAKVVVQWTGQYASQRDSATYLACAGSNTANIGFRKRSAVLNVPPYSCSDVFSGGLAAGRVVRDLSFAAVACSNNETQVFVPSRTPNAPGGTWSALPDNGLTGVRRCAISPDGVVAQYFAASGTVVLTTASSSTGAITRRTLSLGAKFTTSSPLQILSTGASSKRFVIINPDGAVALITNIDASNLTSALAFPDLKSAFSSVSANSRFTANDNFIMQADGYGVLIASLNKDASPTAISAGAVKATSVHVNPCDDNEACAISLGFNDDSWIVSGYYGAYYGVGGTTTTARFPLLLGSQTTYGTAIAHSGLGSVFIYLGTDDGDSGHVPAAVKSGSVTTTASVPNAWVVWRKVEDSRRVITTDHHHIGLVPLPRHPRRASHTAHLEMRTHRGPLPNRIPSDWVHWEPQVALPPPRIEAVIPAAANATTYWPQKIGVADAWALAASKGVTPAPVRLAVIDTGALVTHPFLSNSLYYGPDLADNGIDDDGNGYLDDNYGYDFVLEKGDVVDAFGHGTMCAGLMVGKDPSGAAFSPAGRNGRLTVVRALDKSGSSDSYNLLRALKYVVQSGATIVSCSWGGGPDTQALRDGFGLLRSANITIFSSAGNDGANTDNGNAEVPKIYPGVISVGASDANDGRPSYSNYGASSVMFFAPGDNVLSSDYNNGLSTGSGTSFASPVMASAYAYILGLVLAKNNATAPTAQIKQAAMDALCQTAVKVSALPSICGRISVAAAAQKVLS